MTLLISNALWGIPVVVLLFVVVAAYRQTHHVLSLANTLDSPEGVLLAIANSAKQFQVQMGKQRKQKQAERTWAKALDIFVPLLEDCYQELRRGKLGRQYSGPVPSLRVAVDDVRKGIAGLRSEEMNIRLLSNLERLENALSGIQGEIENDQSE
ncbi:MAG: hypothetical protein ACE5JU_22775 [Candidatus Binatia bacterium]